MAWVKTEKISNLNSLSDVNVASSPTGGQALVYDSQNQVWVNGSVSSVATLNDLTNVTITSPHAGDILAYDSQNQIWVNQPNSSATVLTSTLIAGNTTLTFTDNSITTNSTIDVYVDPAFVGVTYSSLTVSTGSAVFTFPVQSSDMAVKIEVR